MRTRGKGWATGTGRWHGALVAPDPEGRAEPIHPVATASPRAGVSPLAHSSPSMAPRPESPIATGDRSARIVVCHEEGQRVTRVQSIHGGVDVPWEIR
jgi:hypothetical protein